MSFIDVAKQLVAIKKVQEASANILDDIINAVLGDSLSAAKVMIALANAPFLIREKLFWAKIETFLNGVYRNHNDYATLRAKLTENGTKGDNPYRLVECIDRAETQQKIRYLINATRCLLTDFIDLPTYFRICHTVTHTLEEDLQFLRTYVQQPDRPYSQYVQGLLTVGLMYQSVIDGNGEHKYSFTPIAEIVDRYAVSYDDDGRYPNPTASAIPNYNLPISMPSTELSPLSNEEIDQLLKE